MYARTPVLPASMFKEKHAIPLLIVFIISLGLGPAGATLSATGTVKTNTNFKILRCQITQDLSKSEKKKPTA